MNKRAMKGRLRQRGRTRLDLELPSDLLSAFEAKPRERGLTVDEQWDDVAINLIAEVERQKDVVRHSLKDLTREQLVERVVGLEYKWPGAAPAE